MHSQKHLLGSDPYFFQNDILDENLPIFSPSELENVDHQSFPRADHLNQEYSEQEIIAHDEILPQRPDSQPEDDLLNCSQISGISLFLNSQGSFNSFENMNHVVNSISQEYGINTQVTPPNSFEDLDKRSNVKIENADGEETPLYPNVENVAAVVNVNLTGNSGVSSRGYHQNWSQESLGERVPILESFSGKYNFKVIPASNNTKKLQYDNEVNKLFCIDNSEVMFSFQLDFNSANWKNLYVQAVLYYTSNELVLKNIEQCNRCRDEENKAASSLCIPPSGYGKRNFVGHIIRSEHNEAEYSRKRGIYNCVLTPLEKPQAGADKVLRSYKFMCMNSCFQEKGKEYKGRSLVFYLMENKTVEVGRVVMELKVCKCPLRDALAEHKRRNGSVAPVSNQKAGNKADTSTNVISPRKIKLEASVENNGIEGCPPIKVPRLSVPEVESEEAGCSSSFYVEHDSESFSQEVDSTQGRVSLGFNAQANFCKWYDNKDHPDRNMRSFAKSKLKIYESLRRDEAVWDYWEKERLSRKGKANEMEKKNRASCSQGKYKGDLSNPSSQE